VIAWLADRSALWPHGEPQGGCGRPEPIVEGDEWPLPGTFPAPYRPNSTSTQHLCSQSAAPLAGVEYCGVIFQFRIEGGGVLGLLWARENGKWKIVSYQPIRQ